MKNRLSRIAVTAVAAIAVAGLAAPAADAAPKKPKRIVALTPFSANTLVKLGIRPVGVAPAPNLSSKLNGVPEVPVSHASNGPNLEDLVKRDPDLVFSDQTWKAGQSAIEQAGIRVKIAEPYRVKRVAQKIRTIGKVVGRKKQAAALAKRTQRQINKSKGKIKNGPEVMLMLAVGSQPYVFLPKSWGADMVRHAGAKMITDEFGDTKIPGVNGGFAQLSYEQILVRNPDVIIAIPHGPRGDHDEIGDQVRENQYLEATNAGQNNRIYVPTEGMSNAVLQGNLTAPKTIKQIRKKYLKNP